MSDAKICPRPSSCGPASFSILNSQHVLNNEKREDPVFNVDAIAKGRYQPFYSPQATNLPF
jgi:hypothetical protein